MQRIQIIITTISVIILAWCAQVIFSIIYNPRAEYHAGLPRGRRIYFIGQLDGYRQLKKEKIVSGKAYAIEPSKLSHYNLSCSNKPGTCRALPLQHIISSFHWINVIQYIGRYIRPNEPSDILNRIYTLTNLDPLWPYPYVFGELIGPTSKRDHPDIVHARITRDNAKILGEQGISYTCDNNKLKKIKNLTYTEFIDAVERKNPDLRSPCQNYNLPHYLAFNYFQYINNPEQASYYYMVAALHDDVPGITAAMPAIVYGRGGDNLTSATLWYDRFQNASYQYKKLKDTTTDQAKEIEKNIDMTIKKAVSEISMHILATTYPEGQQTGNFLSSTQISNTIRTMLNNCDKERITCELIQYGLQQGWISLTGKLIYPIDSTMTYGRRSDRKIRRLIKKS